MLLFSSQKLQNSISSDYQGDNVGVGKGYGCLYDFFFGCAEALSSFKFENMYQILEFTTVDQVAEDLLSVYFTCDFENIY